MGIREGYFSSGDRKKGFFGSNWDPTLKKSQLIRRKKTKGKREKTGELGLTQIPINQAQENMKGKWGPENTQKVNT